MTDEPKARYPKQEVSEGQEHGYIGEVEVYEPPTSEGGFSNVETEAPAPKGKTTTKSAADAAPEETPIAGESGTISSDESKSKS